MTIPSTGQVHMEHISVELGYGANTTRTLNETEVRDLLGKASGEISLNDARGKSKAVALPPNSIRITPFTFPIDAFWGWTSDPTAPWSKWISNNYSPTLTGSVQPTNPQIFGHEILEFSNEDGNGTLIIEGNVINEYGSIEFNQSTIFHTSGYSYYDSLNNVTVFTFGQLGADYSTSPTIITFYPGSVIATGIITFGNNLGNPTYTPLTFGSLNPTYGFETISPPSYYFYDQTHTYTHDFENLVVNGKNAVMNIGDSDENYTDSFTYIEINGVIFYSYTASQWSASHWSVELIADTDPGIISGVPYSFKIFKTNLLMNHCIINPYFNEAQAGIGWGYTHADYDPGLAAQCSILPNPFYPFGFKLLSINNDDGWITFKVRGNAIGWFNDIIIKDLLTQNIMFSLSGLGLTMSPSYDFDTDITTYTVNGAGQAFYSAFSAEITIM